MKFGVGLFPTEQTPPPAELGRMVEEHGFESLFVTEHTHIPASRQTAYPAGGELPPEYSRTFDPSLTLTAVATATRRLLVATGICLVIERDPIITAKEVATLDHFSGGRFLFGVGAGWNIEEMRNHGTDPATRYELLEERVLAMREIWRSDEATFHGQFVNFDRIWSWPKPVQDPMPVFVGGNSPGAEERAMRAGTGWSPLHLPGIPDRMRAYTEKAAADGVITSALGVAGPLSAQIMEDYASAGAECWLHYIPMTPSADEYERELARLAAVRAEWAGGS